jgi:hypothetical protein
MGHKTVRKSTFNHYKNRSYFERFFCLFSPGNFDGLMEMCDVFGVLNQTILIFIEVSSLYPSTSYGS